jgi:hypothetical protein
MASKDDLERIGYCRRINASLSVQTMCLFLVELPILIYVISLESRSVRWLWSCRARLDRLGLRRLLFPPSDYRYQIVRGSVC